MYNQPHMSMGGGGGMQNAPFQPQGGPSFAVPPAQSPMSVGGMMQHPLGPPPGAHLGVPPPNMSVNMSCMMQPSGPSFFMHHGLPPPGPGPHPFPDRDRMIPPGRGAGVLQPEYKLFELNRRLQSRPPEPECDNNWWDCFCNEFFEDDATLAVSFLTEEGAPELYRIGRSLIGRFFRTLFEAGIIDLYWYVRQPKEMLIRHAPGQRSLLVFDSEQTSLMTQYSSPFCKVVTDGRLLLEFTFDDLMRIRSWSFAIRQYSELVPRHVLMQDDPAYLEHTARNVTRYGLPAKVIMFLKMCVILEPMQELMGRHKVYKISPRECLKKALYDKWLRTYAPPDTAKPTTSKKKKRRNAPETPQSATGSIAGSSMQMPGGIGMMPNSGGKAGLDAIKLECGTEQKEAPPSKKRSAARNRKTAASNSPASAAAAAQPSSGAGQSQPPQSSSPAASRAGVPSAEVMIVGEPQLLGGDVGLEDERVITRVENADYVHGQPSINGPVGMNTGGTALTGPGTPLMSNPNQSGGSMIGSNGPASVPGMMQTSTSGPSTPLMNFGGLPQHHSAGGSMPNGLGMPSNNGNNASTYSNVPPLPTSFVASANGQLAQTAMRGSPLTVPSPANSLNGQKTQNANGARSGSTPLAVGGPMSNQHPSGPGSVGSAASVHSAHSNNAPFNNVAPTTVGNFEFEHQHAAGGSTSSLDGTGSGGHITSSNKRRGSFDS